MEDEELTDRFRIVFMCTGNQARSVIAEHYIRKITEGLPVEVESCGTMDTTGAAALPEAAEAAAALGLDLGSHRSRCYTALDLSKADLVIGFEHHHVATAVVDGAADPSGAFRLLELVRLLEGGSSLVPDGNDPASARARVLAAATARRSESTFVAGEDIADPAGRDSRFFTTTASRIRDACDALVGRLFPSAPTVRAKIWD